MQRHELIDKIFSDALTQMRVPEAAAADETSEKPTKTENGQGQETTVSEKSNDGEVDDLDALLANITAARPTDDDEVNDDDLGEILAPDPEAAGEDEWSGENSMSSGSENEENSDSSLSDVIDSALTIEDVPGGEVFDEGNGVEIAETAETNDAAETDGENIDADATDAILTDVADDADILNDTDTTAANDAVFTDDADDANAADAVDAENSDDISEASSASDDEVEDALRALGLDGDSAMLCNKFSTEKEVLLKHLMHRFEMIARRKLQDLPNEQVKLVRSVNLRVELELKFGEFSAAGDDDSLFQL